MAKARSVKPTSTQIRRGISAATTNDTGMINPVVNSHIQNMLVQGSRKNTEIQKPVDQQVVSPNQDTIDQLQDTTTQTTTTPTNKIDQLTNQKASMAEVKSTGPYVDGVFDPNFVASSEQAILNDPALTDVQKQKLMANFIASTKAGEGFRAGEFAADEDDQLKQFLENQDEDESQLERKINFAKSEIARQEQEQQAYFDASLAGDREGIMSESNESTADKIKGVLRSNFNQQEIALDEQMGQLMDLQLQQQQDYSLTRANQILQLQSNVAAQEAALAEQQAKQEEKAMETIKMLSESGALANLNQDEVSFMEGVFSAAPPGVLRLLSNTATNKFAQEAKTQYYEQQNSALSTLSNLAQNGVPISDQMIIQYAQDTGIPADTLIQFKINAQQIQEDKTLDSATKQLELSKLANDTNLELEGYRTETAKQVKSIQDMLKTGKISLEEAQDLYMNMNIPSALNPITALDTQIKQIDAQAKQIGLRYLDAEKQAALTQAGQEITKNDLDIIIKNAEAANAPAMEILKLKELQLKLEGVSMEKTGMIPASQVTGSAVKEIYSNEKIPPERSRATNALGSGVITGYGSPLWGQGLDFVIDGGMDAPVPSPVSGEIIQVDKGHTSGEKNSFGNRIKIRTDDGEEIWLSHLSNTQVEQGQQVNAGDIIGGQGNTGSTLGRTGIHVDITMKKANGQYYTAKEVQQYLQAAEKVKKAVPVQGVVDDILNSKGSLLVSDFPKEQQLNIKKELSKIREKAIESGDLYEMAKSTAGSEEKLTAAERDKLVQIRNITDQMQQFEQFLDDFASGEISGVFRNALANNKFDDAAEEFNARVNAVLPGIARGVYGEVGVLTDTDLERYKDTLPQIRSSQELKEVLLKMTQDNLSSNVNSIIDTAARSNINVAGYADLIEKVKTGGQIRTETWDQTAGQINQGSSGGYLQQFNEILKQATPVDYSQNIDYEDL